jgi:integration host factor subunit alpha
MCQRPCIFYLNVFIISRWSLESKKFQNGYRLIMAKTLTRADLTESVYRNIGLSRNESSYLVESVLEEICSCLEEGEEVKLSSFGTFSVQSKRRRVGRNPKTGVEAVITPRRVLSFRPSHILKDRVDNA